MVTVSFFTTFCKVMNMHASSLAQPNIILSSIVHFKIFFKGVVFSFMILVNFEIKRLASFHNDAFQTSQAKRHKIIYVVYFTKLQVT